MKNEEIDNYEQFRVFDIVLIQFARVACLLKSVGLIIYLFLQEVIFNLKKKLCIEQRYNEQSSLINGKVYRG